VPAFEGRCTKLLGKLFRGKPDDRPYLAAPLQVRIAGPRRAAFGTVGAVKESGQTQLGGATPGGPRPVEVIEERCHAARAGSVAPSLSSKANISAVTMLRLPWLMVAILVFCAFTAGDLPSRR
jgi:hypothetical protein